MRPYLSFSLVMLLSVACFTVHGQDRTAAEKQLILKLNIFTSDVEKKYFREIASTGSTDLFQLMMIAGNSNYSTASLTDASEKIASFVQQKPQQDKQYTSKEIKKLYGEIHQIFFTRYVDNPAFSQIFSNGNYNCATASALYAILLNKLNVEFSIREKPTHVYIVAAPSSHNIVFETTAPGAMVLQLNDNLKTKYLEYLHKNKLISNEEWENGDRNTLFEKYFYGDEVINLQQMCGLLYYNLGIEAARKEDYATAYKNFEKAYFLHPGARMKYFVSYSLAVHLYKANLNEDEKLTTISRYTQVGDSAAAKEYVADFLEKMSKKYLFQYPDMPKYLSLYGNIVNLVNDTSLLRTITHNHYYDMAHYYSIKELPDSSKIYLDSLYRMNTNDLLIKELMVNTIHGLIRKIPEGKEGAVAVKDYFKAYPFLSSNGTLQDYYIYCLVREAGLSYDMENEKEGRVYLDDLKTFLDGQPAVARRSEKVIDMLVSEACGYYTRKQNYKTVRDLCIFFKKLLPDNANINQRLTNAEKRMNNK